VVEDRWERLRALLAQPPGEKTWFELFELIRFWRDPTEAIAEAEQALQPWHDELREHYIQWYSLPVEPTRATIYSLDYPSEIARLVRSAILYRGSTSSTVRQLTDSPRAESLRRLRFQRSDDVMSDGYRAVAESAHLNNLTHLTFYRTSTPPEWLRPLLHTERLPALTSLTLGRDFSIKDVVAVVASPLVGRLRELGFVNDGMGDDAARVLVEATDLRQLKRLDLQGNNFSPVGRELLRQAPQFANTDVNFHCGSPTCRFCA
jgi:hypothetical protein